MSGEVLSAEIVGECIREMSLTENPWRITLELEPVTRQVLRSHCSCTAGADGICKHTAAIFKYVNTERSEGCTDTEQSWSKPSKKLAELYPKGECIQKLFFGKEAARRDYSGKALDVEKVTNLMKKHSLQNSSVYKSLTVDLSKASCSGSQPKDVDFVPENMKNMLESPLTIGLKTSADITVTFIRTSSHSYVGNCRDFL